MKSFVCLFFVFVASFAANQYDNHQMWRITFPESFKDKQHFLDALETMNVDVWASSKDWVDIRVEPENIVFFMAVVKETNLQVDVKIKNIGSLIEKQKKDHEQRKRAAVPKATIQLDVYHTLDEIYAYLDELAADEVGRVSLQTVGTTYGGVPLKLLRIFASGDGEPGSKPAVWIDCGIHAREWITPATCIWGIDNLVYNYGVDSTVTSMLDSYDFYILPVLNAEGYAYSWTDDRMWRKNRRENIGFGCYGVDLNRNYDDGHWGGGGSSSAPCTSTYHGTAGFSEAETSAVRDKVMELVGMPAGVKTFYSVHSYSQYWMYVYGCCDEVTTDRAELDATAAAGVAALSAVYGTPYTYGDHYNVIYQASGVAIDWSYTNASIPYSYLLELRDTGEYGFLLPEDQILPTAEETWAGIFAAIESQV